MVSDLKVLYPKLQNIKVNISDIEVNLFDALCVAVYAVTHQSGYYEAYSISFINSQELTKEIKKEISEFLYRELGQTTQIDFDLFSDTSDNTEGIDVYWSSRYLVYDGQDISPEIQEEIDRCFKCTSDFRNIFFNHRSTWFDKNRHLYV